MLVAYPRCAVCQLEDEYVKINTTVISGLQSGEKYRADSRQCYFVRCLSLTGCKPRIRPEVQGWWLRTGNKIEGFALEPY